jgi:hypothetical protein
MVIRRDYILEVLNNPRATRKLIKNNDLPIRSLEINLMPMNTNDYDSVLSSFRVDKFKQVYDAISKFPLNWIELNDTGFCNPNLLKEKHYRWNYTPLSKRQANLILNLAKHVDKSKVEVNYKEFFDSVNSFSKDERFNDFKQFLGFSNPSGIGVVKKNYFGEELRLELRFNNIRYSKNA